MRLIRFVFRSWIRLIEFCGVHPADKSQVMLNVSLLVQRVDNLTQTSLWHFINVVRMKYHNVNIPAGLLSPPIASHNLYFSGRESFVYGSFDNFCDRFNLRSTHLFLKIFIVFDANALQRINVVRKGECVSEN